MRVAEAKRRLRWKQPKLSPTGLFPVIPIVDKVVRVQLRTVTFIVPPREVITKDNVPVRVNAVGPRSSHTSASSAR